MTPQLGLEWYEALSDSPAEAHAKHAQDAAKAASTAAMPYADGAHADPRHRANGGAE